MHGLSIYNNWTAGLTAVKSNKFCLTSVMLWTFPYTLLAKAIAMVYTCMVYMTSHSLVVQC